MGWCVENCSLRHCSEVNLHHEGMDSSPNKAVNKTMMLLNYVAPVILLLGFVHTLPVVFVRGERCGTLTGAVTDYGTALLQDKTLTAFQRNAA